MVLKLYIQRYFKEMMMKKIFKYHSHPFWKMRDLRSILHPQERKGMKNF